MDFGPGLFSNHGPGFFGPLPSRENRHPLSSVLEKKKRDVVIKRSTLGERRRNLPAWNKVIDDYSLPRSKIKKLHTINTLLCSFFDD